MIARLSDWWEELDEVDRALWVIAVAYAFTAIAGLLLRAAV